jgi:1,2-diacylglycerol 3-alpha-glucosyltransferase
MSPHLRIESYPAFAKAEARPLFPRLGILNDYVRIPYANGSSFASQFLYREFQARGSEVTVVGPRDPKAVPSDLPPRHILFNSLPLRNHPGVHLPIPNRDALRQLADANLSLTIAQTGSAFIDAGVWLRRNHGVPLVCVNTVHLPSIYDVLLPQALHRNPLADRIFLHKVIPWVERVTAEEYNTGDGLVVLSEGLKSYWQERGVRVPISVIPRSVEPKIFDQRNQPDPFPRWARRGSRLVVVCRHTREKNVLRLIDIFGKHIAPKNPDATLALVGDGPDHDLFKAHARRLGIFERCIWPGETSLLDVPAWYRHADVFVYTSLSETYGQVVSEALWCGLPVVALQDEKGVSDQVKHGSDGFLLDPNATDANEQFAARVLELVQNRQMREAFAARAEAKAHYRSDPARCVRAYEQAFLEAQEHARQHPNVPGPLAAAVPVVRWTGLHMLLAGLGCIRPPAVVNRHNRPQPVWDLEEVPRETTPPPFESEESAAPNTVASVA